MEEGRNSPYVYEQQVSEYWGGGSVVAGKPNCWGGFWLGLVTCPHRQAGDWRLETPDFIMDSGGLAGWRESRLTADRANCTPTLLGYKVYIAR